MTDIQKDVDQAKTDSFILVKFSAFGSGEPEIFFNNVNAFQIIGSASALEVFGKNMFIQQENERAERRRQMQLAVPKPGIAIGR